MLKASPMACASREADDATIGRNAVLQLSPMSGMLLAAGVSLIFWSVVLATLLG